MAFKSELFAFAFFPNYDTAIRFLASMAANEKWDFPCKSGEVPKNSILKNYLENTFRRLKTENKIASSNDGQYACFNTGLATKNLEEIYAIFERNRISGKQPFVFKSFLKKSDHFLLFNMVNTVLPESADYLQDSQQLLFNPHCELIWQIEHIINDNINRFPEHLRKCSDDELRLRVEGAIQEARKRARLNYRLAVPQYFKGQIQLLLPLNLTDGSTKPDLALAVQRLNQTTYTARTCLTLEMAYNNARLIIAPCNNWIAELTK